MKTLKFKPNLVVRILSGEKQSTWRLFDDKDLQAGDELSFVTSDTGEEFAKAHITSIEEKRLGDITTDDEKRTHHEEYSNAIDRVAAYKQYYGDAVNEDSIVKLVLFELM